MEIRRKIGLLAGTFIMVMAIVVIGPVDAFTHGFYCDEIDCGQIAGQDYLGTVDLSGGAYEMTFSPQRPHMNGFEIYLTGQPDHNIGTLCLTVLDARGDTVDRMRVDLNGVREAKWYKVYLNTGLNRGELYTLRFEAENCIVVPGLQRVAADYLPDETVSGDILLSYAYAQSVFTFQEKILLSLFLIVIWMFAGAAFFSAARRKVLRSAAVVIFMISVLSWNYMYNSMDVQNTAFDGFQADSETLVSGMIYAERAGVSFVGEDEQGYGLGVFYDLRGKFDSYDLDDIGYTTDEEWVEGYSRTEPALIVGSNAASYSAAVEGNYVEFENGERFQITGVQESGGKLIVHLDAEQILTPAKYGSLGEIRFCDAGFNTLDSCRIEAYKSQYGLQGRVFRKLARGLDEEQAIDDLRLLCSLAAAAVFVLITLLVAARYNRLMAGCFFVTFWLSPWIVNFARNLYWVEFTWFLPMAIGLFCAWRVHDRKCRLFSYVLLFCAVFGKCLCGYEYITTIMLGGVAFLLADLFCACAGKDSHRGKLLFRTVVVFGCVSLAGFFAAVCVHALIRGEGSIAAGVRSIFEQDVLRRTAGGDLNVIEQSLWPTLNASVWETVCRYFRFGTEVLPGIAGNLFPLLVLAPLCIFCYEFRAKRHVPESAVLYAVFFVTSLSWFCLAKAHSYEHTHLNYVLWYFGYVQICLYTIVDKAAGVIMRNESGRRAG